MKQQFSAYVKYSSLGFQMIGAILLTALLGDWLDGKMGNTKPIMTMILMLLGVTSSIVLLIRGVRATEKKEQEENDSVS